MLEVGRVCIKTAGREAGRVCCIVKKINERFVEVTGPKNLTKVKRRRCNTEHLEPTEFKLKIKAEASDSEILDAYKKEGILKKFGLEKKIVKISEKPKPAKKEPKAKKTHERKQRKKGKKK